MWWAWILCKWIVMHTLINHPSNVVDAGFFCIRMCIATYQRINKYPLIMDKLSTRYSL